MKALWAIEPFHQEKKMLKGMHHVLSLLTGSAAKVEAGFVATRTESSLTLAFDVPEAERFSVYPKKLIEQELKKSQIKMDSKNIHVIDYPTVSTTKGVDRFLQLAADRGADLIGMYTHAKKGYLRFAIGSFAETAIHRSKQSMLILNPQTEVPSKIKNVLYASDFSPSSQKHLKTVIDTCKKLKANLTIFHHTELIYKWSLDETNPEILDYRKGVDEKKKSIEQECKRGGVSVDFVIASDFNSTVDHIFALIKKRKSNMVVVSAKVGPLAALMGGSITRQVIRGSKVPVLVLK